MHYGDCVHCNCSVYESDERVSISIGVAHFECHERYQEQVEADMKEYAEQERKRVRCDNKLISRLKRTLKPKVWNVIELVLQDHWVGYLSILPLSKVTGRKNNAHDWFGESVAIRHIYDDTSSCSYSDTYGGVIYLPIGKERYLQMHISG
ncbi:hypothetical protein [Vibrio vulnificus]|uniref:hypothetical protein n=1 Tax=Vibrio vulnificus TaxID=672 RepID=UPI000CD1DCD5|nr:hypothetical protein [Vibrio vulnificus]POC19549.1 hypothetical protein CRN42_13560 [Vibrio vulnificus]